jgi:putative ABC transport system permease protein
MSWWQSLFRKRDLDSQLDCELDFHLQELIRQNLTAGMSPDQARRRARLAFGGPQQFKEEMREIHGIPAFANTARALKYALRFVRKSPSLSATIILTLALAIGANTAVFSAIDAILLRPLPFPEGDRLIELAQHNPKAKAAGGFIAPVRLEDWSRLNSTFQAITGYYTEDESETTGPLPEKITSAWVTGRFFEVWGVYPARGRAFSPEEERTANNVVVISDRFWRRRFGADPNAIGKKLRLDRYLVTIIGIMPASFLFPARDVDVWSISAAPGDVGQNRLLTWYIGVGRLKRGVTLEQARADLFTVQAQLGKQYPATDRDLAVIVTPLKEVTIGGVRRSLWILFGSVTLLLLLACSNIASLLLAQTTRRAHEIAIRFSLGASRGAIVAQLLAETLVLVLAGSLLALLIAAGASRAFHALAKNLPRADEIRLDRTILLYTLGSAVGATLLCGLLPALRATRRGMPGALAQSRRTQVSARHPLEWALVSVQVALAVTLLAGAGLLLRSFQALGRVSTGFEPAHVLTLRISGNYGETTNFPRLVQRVNRELEALRSTPGVEAAATSAFIPGTPMLLQTELTVAGVPARPNQRIMADIRMVSPDYFAVLQIPLLSGQSCRETPTLHTVVVNRSFVEAYLGGSSALGRNIAFANPTIYTPAPTAIEGVVGDAREQGLNREPVPTVYFCYSAPSPFIAFLVRARGEPMAMAEILRRKMREIDPARSVYQVMPLSQHLAEPFAENRLRTILLTFFAVTAVSLACLGLYGTLSYVVSTRRREVGLRLALGALRGQIVSQFLAYGLRASLVGCAAGLCLAAAFAKVLSGMLFGISLLDPATFIAVVLLVLLTGGLASSVPAIRAASLDPIEVLRDE